MPHAKKVKKAKQKDNKGIYFLVSAEVKRTWLKYAYGEILAGRAQNAVDVFKAVVKGLSGHKGRRRKPREKHVKATPTETPT